MKTPKPVSETRLKLLRKLDGLDLGNATQASEKNPGKALEQAGLLVRDYSGPTVVLRLTDAGRVALASVLIESQREWLTSLVQREKVLGRAEGSAGAEAMEECEDQGLSKWSERRGFYITEAGLAALKGES
jgi:hypothetical protein